jgi:DnaJ-class molecular chaperone
MIDEEQIDLHGECAAEIKRLKKRIESLKSKLCKTCEGEGHIGNMIESEQCPECNSERGRVLIALSHWTAVDFATECDHQYSREEVINACRIVVRPDLVQERTEGESE